MGFELTTLVVIGTDCTGSCNSNYHAIMRAPALVYKYLLKNESGIRKPYLCDTIMKMLDM